ncbi:MAG: Redoxin [Myxococcales bacterium]|nr:Redoxin [Myxococcales bacterium]
MPSRHGWTQQRIALAAILVIALPFAACRRGEKLPDGDIAASLTVEPIGDHFDPGSIKGKPSLVLFVTPTCPHCRVELPRAAAAAQAEGANVVAVFVAGKAENATGVLADAKFPGRALVDDGSLTKRYHIKSVPYALVLGADGHARDAFIGEQDESTLRDALANAK